MRLILKNFRCFKNIDIQFETNGTTLIWGTSGIGKTSIFKAINFVLYGKEQKVVKHGEKKCSVQLFWNNLIITRTRCPNHLSIKQSDSNTPEPVTLCEDDTAQAKIESIFGKDFLLTSYMAQKGIDSFFYLSSTEKAAFLQKLAVKDFNVEEVRKRLREIIRFRKDKLIEISTEKKFIEEQLEDFCPNGATGSPVEITEPRLTLDRKGKTIDEFAKDEEQLRQKNNQTIKQLKQSIDEKTKLILELQEKINKKQVLTALLSEKQNQIDQVENEIEIIKLQDFEMSLEELEQDLSNCKTMIKIYDVKRQWKQAKIEYDAAVKSEEERITEELEDLEDQLKQLEDVPGLQVNQYRNILKCNDILINYFEKEDIDECKSMSDYKDLYESLQESLEEDITTLSKLNEMNDSTNKKILELTNKDCDILKNIDILKNTQQKALQCPSCDIYFYIDNISTSDGHHKDIPIELSDDIQEHTVKIEEFNKKHSTIQSELEKLKTTSQTVTKKIDKIKIDINNKKNDLKTLQPIMDNDESLPDEIIQDYIDRIDELAELKNRHQFINKSILNLKKQLEFNPQNLSKYISEKRNKVVEYKKNYEWLIEQNADLDLWDEEEARKELPVIINQIQIKQHIVKQNSELKKKIEKLNSEYTSINTDLDKLLNISDELGPGPEHNPTEESSPDTILEEIEQLKEKLNTKEQLQEKLQRRKEKIETYIVNLEKWNKYNSIKFKLSELNSTYDVYSRALVIAQELLNKINDAESISLQTTVDNINSEMEEYVTAFFGENVTIQLNTFRQTKDGDKKSCIDVSIIRDGEQVPVESLSGGEFDRVALALFLAFNKVSKSKLIMLDECLSSLHSELVEEIVDMIKTKLRNKLVLITLHQANTGMFDNVINIEQYRCCE
jgi:DNA repair exonuclease SbcCD ATPase subunit